MIKYKTFLIAGLLALTTSVQADEVIASVPDNTLGQAVGGWSSFLLGGAVAGPVGAIVGGIAGVWAGGNIQQATNNSENGYLVKGDNGTTHYIRSPNQAFSPGDQVKVVGIRVVADENQSKGLTTTQ